MIGRIVLAVGLLSAATSATLAEQNPTPVKQDGRIRLVAFDPNDVVAIEMATGNALTVEMPAGYEIVDVALSDTKDIQRATRNDNIVFLKAMRDVPEQPGFLKVRRPDGSQLTCVLQIAAKEGAKAPYLVRFTDPVAERAKMAAAWREREAARRQAEANAALANPAPTLNSNYAIKGTPMPGAAPPPPPVAPGAAPLAPAASAGPTAPVNQSYSMNGHRMPLSKQPDDVTQSLGGRY